MLSSRNRSLKRRSRVAAFFVIIAAGCFHRFYEFYQAFKRHTSAESFVRDSSLVPPIVKAVYEESQRFDLKKRVIGSQIPRPTTYEKNLAEGGSRERSWQSYSAQLSQA